METRQKLGKKEALKELRVIHNKLYALDNIEWEKLYSNYVAENRQEEKRHDNFRGKGISRGITISEAAMLFSVVQLAKYIRGDKAPDVAGYTYMRKSIFTAYSLYARYTDIIKKAFEGYDVNKIANIDYAYMVE